MYRHNNKNINTKKGAALMMAVLFFLIISIAVVMGAVGPLVRELQNAQSLIRSKTVYFLSEAGSEDVVYRFRTGKQVLSPEILSLYDNTVTTIVTDVGSNAKQIISEGDVSGHIRLVKTDLTTSTGVAFAYGAQVGEGGLYMGTNTSIEGVGGAVGNVYSNGSIIGNGNNVITGDAIVSTNIVEDNQARSTVCNQDKIVGQSNPEIDFAQSFVPGDSQSLAKISIYIKKVGSPSSRTVRIVDDNAGSPATSELASGTLNSSLVGSNYDWIDIVFSTPPPLIAGQTYWVVLDASRSNTKYWVWCSDSNNGFGNGVAKYSEDWDNDAWSFVIGDFAFKTYLGAGINKIDDSIINGDARANTITNSSIGGDAYYNTDFTGSSAGGTEYFGSADPAVLNMPISQANIDGWKDEALSGGTISGNCPGTPGCSNSMGPVKIDGNLTLLNGETLTVNGTLYVAGNIIVENNSSVSCSVGYADDSCIIVSDGWIDINNNVVFSGSGNPDSYIMVLSTLTGCIGGSGSGCGPQYSAINISNNTSGALFYAPFSLIYINNNVDITSVVGYKLELSSNAVVRYEIGATNVNFSAGPGGGWKVKSWRETE